MVLSICLQYIQGQKSLFQGGAFNAGKLEAI